MGRKDVKDERNRLFSDFFRLVKEIQPKFFVAENVLGILHPRYDQVRQEALDIVKDDYILLKPLKIKASDYGVPTTRTRVFFIGYRLPYINDLTEKSFLPSKEILPVLVKEALEGLPSDISYDWQDEEDGWQPYERIENINYFTERISGHIPLNVGDSISLKRFQNNNVVSGCLGTRHSEIVANRYALLEHDGIDKISKAKKLNPDGFCPTLRAGTGSDKGSYQAVRPIHHDTNRVITPREAARLQGFPDWFVFHKTKWHSFRQIGNSVSPILAEQLLTVIFNKLSNK